MVSISNRTLMLFAVVNFPELATVEEIELDNVCPMTADEILKAFEDNGLDEETPKQERTEEGCAVHHYGF